MLIAKLHKQVNGTRVLALCDKDILGKKFSEGKIQIDLSSNFYNGSGVSDADLIKLMNSANILNIVGEKAVGFAVKYDVVDKGNVLLVSGIPHAQVVKV